MGKSGRRHGRHFTGNSQHPARHRKNNLPELPHWHASIQLCTKQRTLERRVLYAWVHKAGRMIRKVKLAMIATGLLTAAAAILEYKEVMIVLVTIQVGLMFILVGLDK